MFQSCRLPYKSSFNEAMHTANLILIYLEPFQVSQQSLQMPAYKDYSKEKFSLGKHYMRKYYTGCVTSICAA